jgi:hypothetical protein
MAKVSPLEGSPQSTEDSSSSSVLHEAVVSVCLALMGPGAADTTTGRTLMRGLRRAVRDMTEDELRENLTDIRDKLSMALDTPEVAARLTREDDGGGGYDVAALAQGD